MNDNDYQTLEADEVPVSSVSCGGSQSSRILKPVVVVGLIVAVVSAVHYTTQAHVDAPTTSSMEEIVEDLCVATYSKCGGGDSWEGTTECCESSTACFSKDSTYAQCRYSCPSGWKCEADREQQYREDRLKDGKQHQDLNDGTVTPSVSPSNYPTASDDSNAPTSWPSHYPTRTHNPFPTAYPTEMPTVKPTHKPSGYPTDLPTPTPSTDGPSPKPTKVPTPAPTTHKPSGSPTVKPTTAKPSISQKPSYAPSILPTRKPSYSPSTTKPTYKPTPTPTTPAPSGPTVSPSFAPTSPSVSPSYWNSSSPTQLPSVGNTSSPSYLPTLGNTSSPSYLPTFQDTTWAPSIGKTSSPSYLPTFQDTTWAPSSNTSTSSVDPHSSHGSQSTVSSDTVSGAGTGYGDGRLQHEINDSDDETDPDPIDVTEGSTDTLDDDEQSECGDWLNEKLSVYTACSDFVSNLGVRYPDSDACSEYFCEDCKYAHYCDSYCSFC